MEVAFDVHHIDNIVVSPQENDTNVYYSSYKIIINLKNKVEAKLTNIGSEYAPDPSTDEVGQKELLFESSPATEALNENLLRAARR